MRRLQKRLEFLSDKNSHSRSIAGPHLENNQVPNRAISKRLNKGFKHFKAAVKMVADAYVNPSTFQSNSSFIWFWFDLKYSLLAIRCGWIWASKRQIFIWNSEYWIVRCSSHYCWLYWSNSSVVPAAPSSRRYSRMWLSCCISDILNSHLDRIRWLKERDIYLTFLLMERRRTPIFGEINTLPNHTLLDHMLWV